MDRRFEDISGIPQIGSLPKANVVVYTGNGCVSFQTSGFGHVKKQAENHKKNNTLQKFDYFLP